MEFGNVPMTTDIMVGDLLFMGYTEGDKVRITHAEANARKRKHSGYKNAEVKRAGGKRVGQYYAVLPYVHGAGYYRQYFKAPESGLTVCGWINEDGQNWRMYLVAECTDLDVALDIAHDFICSEEAQRACFADVEINGLSWWKL